MKYMVWNECYVAGGADWSLIDLITHWPNKEDSFVVYVNHSHEGLDLLCKKMPVGVEVTTFNSAYESAFSHSGFIERNGIYNLKIVRMLVLAFYFTQKFFQYSKFFSGNKFDILLMNNGGYPGGFSNFTVALLAKWKGLKKRFMIVRNYPIVSYKQSLGMYLAKIISNYAIDKIISVSDSLNNSILQLSGVNEKKLIRIHNGISLNNKGQEKEKLFEISSPAVGIIGALQERKGHKLLFHAWAEVIKKHPYATLYVVGSSKSGDIKGLKELAEKLHITKQLRWIDFCHDVGAIYKSLDIVVMPSLEYESFGRIIIEAMAFGTPIVASNVGGIPELIQHGKDGYLFERNNKNELTQYLCDLLDSETTRNQIGSCGIEKYKNGFTAKRMAEEYSSMINQEMKIL